MNKIAEIGHNQPPEKTPFELISAAIDSSYETAKDYLDGEPVTEEQEAEVNAILDEIKALSKKERALFTVTKQPHKDAAKAVDDAHNPLKKKLENAKETALLSLAPLRIARDKAKQEEIAKAQKEAAAKALEARELARSSSNTDLAARDEVDKAEKDAKKLTAKASAISKQATGLRAVWNAYPVNLAAAAKHYFPIRRDEFKALLHRLAMADVRSGVREIPGYEIKEEKVAR